MGLVILTSLKFKRKRGQSFQRNRVTWSLVVFRARDHDPPDQPEYDSLKTFAAIDFACVQTRAESGLFLRLERLRQVFERVRLGTAPTKPEVFNGMNVGRLLSRRKVLAEPKEPPLSIIKRPSAVRVYASHDHQILSECASV
jgi:hypothetical protein